MRYVISNEIWVNVLFLLGGIAVMMFGMRTMGSNLEQVSGKGLKNLLGRMTNNRLAGVGVGAAVTAIINSSAATTVMLVGFVNVGLMTLAQATSVIMGANIGTTITAQILSLTGAGFEVAAIAAGVAALGMVLALFVKKDRVQKVGYILMGIGMIFVGLKIMSMSVNGIIYDAEGNIKPFFNVILNNPNTFPLLLVVIGIVLTALIQSSAAVTGILIAIGGAMNFRTAVFIILGSNIGTCVTAIISSIGTSTNAKRTAVIHLLFNLFGCIIYIVPMWIWSAFFANLMEAISGPSIERQIANFHTIFNLVTTIILLPFAKVLVSLAEKIVPEKHGAQEEKHRLTFIDDRLLGTPPIAVSYTKKEIIKMAGIARENMALSMNMLLKGSLDDKELLEDNEDAINYLNHSITAFMTTLMGKELNTFDERRLGSYYHVVTDIERVGDYAENIMEYAEKLKEEDGSFSEEAIEELRNMYKDVDDLFSVSVKAFEKIDASLLPEVDILEESIDAAAMELEKSHIERVKKGNCTVQLGSVYLQAVANLERVGDHITNIAYSIINYRHR